LREEDQQSKHGSGPRDSESLPPGSEEDIVVISVDPDDPSKTVRIGAGLPTDKRDRMIKFLSDNLDVFAWCTTDMPGIDPEIICH